MNIAAMARKFLALPLTGISWFPVADFDILVDPDLSERFEHYLPAQLLIGSATLWQEISKLHNSAGPLPNLSLVNSLEFSNWAVTDL
jgi:hypothetical protein